MFPASTRNQNMAIHRHILAITLLATCILALPTELASKTDETATASPISVQKNDTNLRKQTLTYILKNGAVQSPAELLSPDRYEFYTFDDDGQIIKKLMSVEEIQRIIANSKKGLPPDTEHIGDYYQVLSVSPELESQPAVRVNPHEPLFSIHDVISSVQNVLKGEINSKLTSQASADAEEKEADEFAELISTESSQLSVPSVNSLNKFSDNKTGETTLQSTTDTATTSSITRPTEMKIPSSTVHAPAIVSQTATKLETPSTSTTTMKSTSKPDHPTVFLKTPTIAPPKVTQTSSISSVSTKETIRTSTSKTTISGTKKHTVSSSSKKPTGTTKKPSTEAPKKTVTIVQKDAPITTSTTTTTTVKPTTSTATDTSKTSPPATTLTSSPSGVTTKVEIQKVTSTVSQSNAQVNQLPLVTTTLATTTSESNLASEGVLVLNEQKNNVLESPSTEKVISTSEQRTDQASQPLSLIDAHPAYTSNDTYFNVPVIPESVFTVENLLFDNVEAKNKSESSNNITVAESVLSEIQFPINQDLAESVSSVLSQIANEINELRLNDLTTTEIYTTNAAETTDPIITSTEQYTTTIVPDLETRRYDEKEESTEASTLSDETNEITTASSFFTTLKPESKLAALKLEESTTEYFAPDSTTIEPIESRTDSNDIIFTESPTTMLPEHTPQVTVLPDLVRSSTQPSVSEAEKKNEVYNTVEVIESNDSANSSIEIIQEAETGRIPRPTQRPNEISTRPGTKVDLSTEIVFNSTVDDNSILPLSTSTLASSHESPATPEEVELFENGTELGLIDTTTDENNSLLESFSNESSQDSAEKISISFVPMVIRSSTTPATIEIPQNILTEKIKVAEDIKIIPTEEIMESKIVDDGSDLGSVLHSSQKIIASSEDDKITLEEEQKNNSPTSNTGGLKQSYGKPQNNVKGHKPVFIKPTKSKPQLVDAKPSKPLRPMSSEEDQRPYETPLMSSPSALELDQAPPENLGLEATTVHLEPDVREFVDLCNELAFSLWASITHNGLSFVRSVVVSPFAVTSLLAMVFLGARGPTSGQMNDILKLDDVVTFNPHLVFRNVTESLVIARNPGVATAAFVRELYSDRSKGKLLDFYKERAQQFYDGHVEEINFKAVGETLRRQTNHLVKRQTWGKIKDFLQGSTLMLRPPLAAFSANIFQADCSRASTKDRDGEMYFVVLPSSRLRRLVPVPAAVWRDDFLAGYEPNLDATVAAVGAPGGIVSTIFVMPGQQGLIAPGDSLARLEHHLLGSSFKRGHWSRLMRSLLRRPGLELQVPRITHKSVVNVTASLQKMGLKDLFSAERADLTGLNGLANDLHLSDMVQVNMFSTCGDEISGHHSEYYPATPLQRKDKSADNIFAESIESLFAVSDFDDPSISALPLELRPRQARIPSSRIEGRAPDPPRLRLDRPFMFFVRHNPTGIILHIGRFNPRLMH